MTASVNTRRASCTPAPLRPEELQGLQPLLSKDLTSGSEIGKGRFKQVHQGSLRFRKRPGSDQVDTHADIVILRYAKDKSESKNELQVLSLLARQPDRENFVPTIYGTCDERRATLLIQERALWGSLKAAVVSHNDDGKQRFTIAHSVRACVQVARAMAFLAAVHIVHADLSCRNLLVCRLEEDADCLHVKVTDFGLAIVLKEGADSECRKQPQATRWCAPETVSFSRNSHRSDCWSMGATFWELFSRGAVPWASRTKRSDVATELRKLGEAFADGEAAGNVTEEFPCPAECPQGAHEALLTCLNVDEHARPGFEEVASAFEQLSKKAPETANLEARPGAKAAEALKSERPDGGGSSVATTTSDVSATLEQQDSAGNSASSTPPPPGANPAHAARFKALASDFEQAVLAWRGHSEVSCRSSVVLPFRQSSPEQRTAVALTDEFVPLVPQGSRSARARTRSPGSELKAWKLHSLVNTSLLRERSYAGIDQAFLAFGACARDNTPCVLRDPQGNGVAAKSWFVMEQTPTVPSAPRAPMPAWAWVSPRVSPRSLSPITRCYGY